MVNKIVTEDEIILYWRPDKRYVKGYKYCVCNANKIIYTEKTHYTIKNLEACSCLDISVSMVNDKNCVIKEYEKEKIYLPKAKKRLDITKAPYFAVGDGRTLNTEKIQRALNDCKRDELVYIPKGDRKSTRLNSSHAELSRMPSSA